MGTRSSKLVGVCKLITASPTSGFDLNESARYCKTCNKKISIGEMCLSYRRSSGRQKSSKLRQKKHRYHCLECAQRYNPMAFEEECKRLLSIKV